MIPRCSVLIATICLLGCTDLRDFSGRWEGPRVGDDSALRVGMEPEVRAVLTIDEVTLERFRARLTTDDGRFAAAEVAPVAGAEADRLAQITWDGSPIRVYLAFVEATDGGGTALAVIALYDDHRVELRLLRGGSSPLYGVFHLSAG